MGTEGISIVLLGLFGVRFGKDDPYAAVPDIPVGSQDFPYEIPRRLFPFNNE